jgi:TatD DNase family protein
MHFVDTHCHIDLYPDYARLIDETEYEQVYTIAVTNIPSVFHHCKLLIERKKYIRTALGFHPQLVRERHSELMLFFELLNETRYIGEIGLDFTTKDLEDRAMQKQIFTSILNRCAAYKDKILTIHSRRATTDTLDLIGNNYPGKIILHWFSGSLKELERAISYGFYFSINASMLSGTKGRQLISSIPIEKILTETDGPFVKVEGRSIRPTDMNKTISDLADLLGQDQCRIYERVYNNFRRLLHFLITL